MVDWHGPVLCGFSPVAQNLANKKTSSVRLPPKFDEKTRLDQTFKLYFYLKLADGLISWTSCAQKTITYSSTKAEYMSLSDCTCQVTWIQSLLGELGYKLKAIPICSDNHGSIFMASNPVMEPCSKHIDICYHRIQSQSQKVMWSYSLLMVLRIAPICSPRTYGLQFPSGSI